MERKDDKVVPMTNTEKVERLESFKADVLTHEKERIIADLRQALRSKINQGKTWARRQVIEASCFHTITMSPPPAVGGLIMRDLDPFEMLFERPYLQSMVPRVIDIIDQTIGVPKAGPEDVAAESEAPIVEENIAPNYAFVAMPMDESSPELVDVLEAIKEGCRRCGIQAEGVDEPESNKRITDLIVESICKAEYVLVRSDEPEAQRVLGSRVRPWHQEDSGLCGSPRHQDRV